MGMRTDTHLVGQDYSNVAMMFYIGFLVAEFPTQYLAQRISRLGKYLGANVMIWGIVLACMAATSSYAGMMICRTLLGVFEAPVAPILVLIIAMWYKKGEQGRRVSYFYVCNSLTQIFGGAVAYGASFSNSQFASWRIFMLTIGLMTIVIGGIVFMFLPDSPVKATRFTPAERVAALLRVKENQSGTQNARIKKEQILESMKDVRVWLVALSVMLTSIPNGGLSNFSSILLTTFGYTSQQALIMGLPSGAVGVFVVLLTGYLSDRWNDRSMVMLLCLIPTIIAAAMSKSTLSLFPVLFRISNMSSSVRPRPHRNPKVALERLAPLCELPLRYLRRSFHAAPSMERIQPRRALKESHRQRPDARLLLCWQYLGHADVPEFRSTRLQER